MDMERWIEKQTISLGRRVGKECEEARFDDQVFDGDAAYSPAHISRNYSFVPADVVVEGYNSLWT